jgi:hypothetical protein
LRRRVGRALAAQFGEPVPMKPGHPVMAVTEPLPVFMDLSLGMEGGGIYARQVARGNVVFGGGHGHAIDDERARPSDDVLLGTMRQGAGPAGIAAHPCDPQLERHRGLPARQAAGHRSERHHAQASCTHSASPAAGSRSGPPWARRWPT